MKCSTVVITVLAICFGIVASAQTPNSSAARPLSVADVEMGLKSGVSNVRMATLVRQFGIDFTLTSDNEKQLRGAGADGDLLLEIAKRRQADSSPAQSEQASRTLPTLLNKTSKEVHYTFKSIHVVSGETVEDEDAVVTTAKDFSLNGCFLSYKTSLKASNLQHKVNGKPKRAGKDESLTEYRSHESAVRLDLTKADIGHSTQNKVLQTQQVTLSQFSPDLPVVWLDYRNRAGSIATGYGKLKTSGRKEEAFTFTRRSDDPDGLPVIHQLEFEDRNIAAEVAKLLLNVKSSCGK